jgi:hypothetical protein
MVSPYVDSCTSIVEGDTELGTDAIYGGEQMAGRVRSRFITRQHVRLPHRHEAPALMPYAVRMREGRCCCRGRGYIDGRERKQAAVAPRESIRCRLHCGSAQQQQHIDTRE